ncbi:hypothetical protein LCM10_04395 [Rossellomorea aquimaris]|uniref:hypothetical protein n=1 Tax=Rossellomorea aquimaris TaxID=189382 RepID=UPI001CD462A7|nr:hypothetical protein [Rossellomorea aquimaris]MCA1054217.1 hypothetical protein [Rossellomorea aquimaris]
MVFWCCSGILLETEGLASNFAYMQGLIELVKGNLSGYLVEWEIYLPFLKFIFHFPILSSVFEIYLPFSDFICHFFDLSAILHNPTKAALSIMSCWTVPD